MVLNVGSFKGHILKLQVVPGKTTYFHLLLIDTKFICNQLPLQQQQEYILSLLLPSREKCLTQFED